MSFPSLVQRGEPADAHLLVRSPFESIIIVWKEDHSQRPAPARCRSAGEFGAGRAVLALHPRHARRCRRAVCRQGGGARRGDHAFLRRAGPRRPASSAPRWSPPGSSPATAWRSGAATAPNGRWLPSACSPPAPSWCRSTPASRAPRPRWSWPAAGPASSSLSPTSWAPTTWPCSRARVPRCPSFGRSSWPRVMRRDTRCRGVTSSPEPPRPPGPRSTAAAPRWARTIPRTSSSPRARPASRREWS